MDNFNNLGLLNSLSNIINSGCKDSDYAIANFLLNNIHHLNKLTIGDVIYETYTSRSAIRRFSEKLGYKNFTSLQKSISEIIFPSDLSNRKFNYNNNYKTIRSKQISTILDEINNIFTSSKIDYICGLIHNYKNVLLLCANNTSGDMIRFQQELLYSNKVIKIISNSYQSNMNIINLDSEPLIIVVSASGAFANQSNTWLREIKGKKIIFTVDHGGKYLKTYFKHFFLSDHNYTTDQDGLYGKYGITYTFDLISMRYIELYGPYTYNN